VRAAVEAFGKHERREHPAITGIIATLGEAAIPAVLSELTESGDLVVRKRLLEVVLRQGTRAIPHVRPLLGDERWFVVRNAVFLLRRLGDRELAQLAKELIPQAAPQVLVEILKTLVAADDPEWLRVLLTAIDGKDEARASAALAVAAKVAHPAVVAALAERLRERIGLPLREPFTVKLIRALRRLRDVAALPVLDDIVHLRQWRYPFTLTQVRAEAAAAIAAIPGPQARRLAAELVHDHDPAVVKAVAESGRRPPDEAEEP
jgi:HEAT repeat protein